MIYETRRQRVQQILNQEGLDALLLTNPVNVSYLTGFSGDSSYLIVTARRTVLVSDGRFTAQIIEEECPGLERHIRPPAQTVGEAAAGVLNKLGIGAVGFESGHLTVAEYEKLRDLAPTLDWKGKPDRIEGLRAIKDTGEVEQVRQAIRMAERAFLMFRAMLRPEDQEKELADAMEMYVRRAGGRCSSFPSIVAIGDRSALPHAPPTPRKVSEAGLLLVDWGASGPFYKSDLTRVLFTNNKSPVISEPNEKIGEVYAAVLRARERALEALRPGVSAGEVDSAARAEIAAAGFGEFFTHGLGHGIGLEIHETPFLKPGIAVEIQAGMIVTIEPGIYLPGWGGIRIEDDVLVTPDGCQVLTSLPRELEANRIDF